MEEDKHGRDAFRLREEMPTFARISHPQQNEVGPQKMWFCIHKGHLADFVTFLILIFVMFFSPENWVQPITDGIENQIQPPFILYKTKDSDIYGIWFYEEEKCRKIGGTLTKFVAQSEEQRQQQASAGGARKMDLSSLLNKANNKASKELDKPNP